MERGAAPTGVVRNHALGRLRASCRAALGPLCEVLAGRGPSRPPGGQGATTVWNGTGAEVKGRKRRTPEARPGAAAEVTPPEMPRWSAERRAGQRYWPVIPGEPGIGPTARRATGCGVPHPAPVGAPLPSCVRGETEQTSGAKTRRENDRAWDEAELDR